MWNLRKWTDMVEGYIHKFVFYNSLSLLWVWWKAETFRWYCNQNGVRLVKQVISTESKVWDLRSFGILRSVKSQKGTDLIYSAVEARNHEF